MRDASVLGRVAEAGETSPPRLTLLVAVNQGPYVPQQDQKHRRRMYSRRWYHNPPWWTYPRWTNHPLVHGRWVTSSGFASVHRPGLFRLFAASGHQKLLRTAKHSAFQSSSIKFVWVKTIQNQHKHIIGWVVAIVVIRYFIDPEPHEQLYHPPYVILMILRFSTQPDSSHN
jgi:hypothetical protein